ncbi:hypothetical protein C8Q75DRAFT_115642 [Abortiporus biennis]|nr:hypothetical protein C8Q75DRAFT_115642 [Abortiporus biennis]
MLLSFLFFALNCNHISFMLLYLSHSLSSVTRHYSPLLSLHLPSPLLFLPTASTASHLIVSSVFSLTGHIGRTGYHVYVHLHPLSFTLSNHLLCCSLLHYIPCCTSVICI